jgi:DNA repair protein RadC
MLSSPIIKSSGDSRNLRFIKEHNRNRKWLRIEKNRTLKQVRAKRRRYDFEGRRITSPLVCYNTLESILDLKAELVEKFGIIALNVKKEINGIHIICSGIVNRALVEPREVFMAALQK